MDNIIERENLDEVRFKYNSALKVLQTKLEVMYNEFEKSNRFNPIEHIKGRIKSDSSICEKLANDGYEITIDNIEENIHDIAGIRIVCSFLSDIERIENIIKEDKDIQIIRRKDYINNPKSTGYSSLHLNVLIPVKMINKTEYVEAEIQIRTIAMDMWASLEHKILYKKEIELPTYMQKNILDVASTTRKIDNFMTMIITENENYSNRQNYLPKDKAGLSEISKTSMLKYQLALKQIKDKIENIDYEFDETQDLNPIEHIKTRIKSPISITQKLETLGYEVNKENMEKHIHDIVGIRIVCSFLSDVEEIKNILESDSTLNIIKVKDYINNPKQNGYRSYHLNVLVPVKMINRTENVEVEIQIRTIAQDMWASLEHKISYKNDEEISPTIKKQLKLTSDISNEIDITMEELIKSSMKLRKDNKAKKLIPVKNSVIY